MQRRNRPPVAAMKTWQIYLFLTPMILVFAGFTVWPTIASWWYSFFEWDGVGAPQNFVGLANFTETLSSDRFWAAFLRSFLFGAAALLIELPLALVAAIVLNDPRLKGRSLYRLLLFIPVVSTTAVISVVIALILAPVGGAVNIMLNDIGLISRPINFLGSTSTALPTVIAVELWKGFGLSLIYWLAALQTVPKDVIESARIDGARAWQTLLHVKLPIMVPIALVIIILTFERSLNSFDIVQTMTRGGPAESTQVVSTYIYQLAFNAELSAPRYGYASAIGVVFGVLTLAFTGIQALLIARARKAR